MPYPVEICFRALGEIKIDNNINSLNIYPPCEKIWKRCDHKHKKLETDIPHFFQQQVQQLLDKFTGQGPTC